MKPSWAFIVLAALAGIGIGYLLPRTGCSGGKKDGEMGGKKRTAMGATKASLRHEAKMAGPIGKLRRDIRTAEPEKLPSLVYRALELPDPLERRVMLLEALKVADASNAMAIMEEFGRISRETGRIQHDEWKTALFEIGRRGGVEVMEAWKKQGRNAGSTQIQSSLYGWATEDPQAAMAWLNGPDNADYPGKEQLFIRVLAGAALNDADLAVRLMEELPESSRLPCVGHFTWNLIQNQGLDRAVDWMIEVQRSSATREPAYAKAVENEIFNRVFLAAEWSGGAGEMAEQLERIHAAVPISPQRLASTVGRMHGTSGLDLADHLAQTPVFADPDAARLAVSHAMAVAARHSPQALRQWLDRHPSSPLQSQIEERLGE